MTYCLDARAAEDQRFPGVGRYARNLAVALASELAPSERLLVIGDERKRALPSSGAVDFTPLPAGVFSLAHHWRVHDVLRERQADLYHSPYFLLPLRIGVPCVVSIHDLIPFRYPQYFPPLRRAVLRAALRRAARVARSILTLSMASGADLQRFLGVGAERITVTSLAADPRFSPQPRSSISAARDRLGLPERYILCVGSDRPHKNLPRLVDAWHRLQPRPEVLVIAGAQDPRHSSTRRRAEELALGRSVVFLQRVPDEILPSLYSGADLFAFPSEWEGFGLPVIEAMACGTPVACSAISPLEEVAAGAAALFSPLDVDSIAETIRTLLDDRDRRADLARRGGERAASLSWSDTARATLKVYRSALERRCSDTSPR